MERILVMAGYTPVPSTSNSQEFCLLHREHRHDLIVLDLVLPGMDGLQVMQALQAMKTCTGIGTVFVDHQLRILRFTPTVSILINLIETDIGRPVDQIRSNLASYDHLADDLNEVLRSLVPKEQEVQTNSGEWYLLRIRPYRTLENVIEGAVITFTDITAMKAVQLALHDSEILRSLAEVVIYSRDAILVQNLEGSILAWNPSAQRMYGWTEAEALTMNIRDLMPTEGREAALALERKIYEADDLEPKRTQRVAKNGQTLKIAFIVSALVNEAGETYAFATTERTITD